MKAAGALVALVGCLALWVPVAGAAPVNDNFANAEDLGTTLPVQVERSNYGATKETGEPSPGVFGATGHSVWFKWKAAGAGFVTVNTCRGQYSLGAVLGVYTGSAVDALTEVAGSFASQGPDCPASEFGSAVTFKAMANVEYEILVDGYQRSPKNPTTNGGRGASASTFRRCRFPPTTTSPTPRC